MPVKFRHPSALLDYIMRIDTIRCINALIRYFMPNITPALKRALRGKTLKPITKDYTMKEVNSMLTLLLGKPGVSAGKGQLQGMSGSSGSSGMAGSSGSSGMAGESTSAYNPSQTDSYQPSGGATALAAGIGVIRDLLAYFHADTSAQIAYQRQNVFYDNHLSMPAKVQEYQDAGLNPMGLAGSGVGATSAPSVQPSETPSTEGLTSLLGSLLGYKAQMARIEVDKKRVDVQEKDIASRIEYRAEQKYYQHQLNEWFTANQIVSLSKMQAETKLALEKVNTEETQQRLNEAGVTAEQARAALDFQAALQKEWENSDTYRSAELGLMRAHANLYNADAAESWENVKNLIEVRNNVIQDTALKLANTELGKQMLRNLGLTEQQIQFAVDHQKGDLIFQRIGQVTSSLKDVGIATASFAATATGVAPLLAAPPKKIGF